MAKVAYSIYDSGMDGMVIAIESHITNGLPSVIIVGLANKAVDEAKERIRSAFASSSMVFPKKRVTINLAPADEPKESASLDLGVAVSLIAESSPSILARDISKTVFIGELSLGGLINPVRGVLGKLLAAKKHGFESALISEQNATQAAVLNGIKIIPVKSLSQAVEWLSGVEIEPVKTLSGIDNLAEETLDFSEVAGHEIAKRCLEIAASGNHNIILNGPPGTGKSMLAKSLQSILPKLDISQIQDSTHIHSMAGYSISNLVTAPPFRSPHHSSSSVSIIGGGQNSRPGEISLAHNGVLFLDEFPEFKRDCLEALRQPLEDRIVSISRAKKSVTYPANFMLVATKNPCPCGFYGTKKQCSCSAYEISRYNKKLSGPIMDRIDMFIDVEDIPYDLLVKKNKQNRTSPAIRERVKNCRYIQRSRNPKNKLNSELATKDFADLDLISEEANEFFVNAAKKLRLSARSFIKTLRVARTIADLDEEKKIAVVHISEALQYRNKLQTV